MGFLILSMENESVFCSDPRVLNRNAFTPLQKELTSILSNPPKLQQCESKDYSPQPWA